jgi:hypothetical protein
MISSPAQAAAGAGPAPNFTLKSLSGKIAQREKPEAQRNDGQRGIDQLLGILVWSLPRGNAIVE